MQCYAPSVALRTAHGNAKKLGREVVIEVPPADELKPLQQGEPQGATSFGGKRHRLVKGSAEARAVAAKGGAARAARRRLEAQLSTLGLGDLAASPELKTYIAEAELFREACAAELCELAGSVGASVSSMLASAALQLAGSRYLFILAGREKRPLKAEKVFARSSSLADSSRQNILAAYHLADIIARSKGRSRPSGGVAARAAADRAAALLEERRTAEEQGTAA